MFNLFKKDKTPKPITIIGKYEGSHPEIPNSVLNASLRCDEHGVDLSFNKGQWALARHFDWSEIEGFDFDFGNERRVSGKETSAARVVAFGLAGAAVKKKKYDSGFYVQNVLYTKSGNVELILEKHYTNTGDMATTATNLESMSHTSKSTKFKKYVLSKLNLESSK